MDSDHPRLKALQLLKLSSIAYLEARERHDETAAVAAARQYFEEYEKTTTSRAYQAATPTIALNQAPASCLTDLDFDEVLPERSCAGKYEACKAKEVTDADVRAFVNGKKNDQTAKVPESTSSASTLRNVEPKFQTVANIKKNEPSSPFPSPVFFHSKTQNDGSPPSKVSALAAPAKPASIFQSHINDTQKISQSLWPKRVEALKPVGPQTSSFDKRYQVPKQSTTSDQRASPRPTTQPNASSSCYPDFTSARRELSNQNLKQYNDPNAIKPKNYTEPRAVPSASQGTTKKLGGKFSVNTSFKCPIGDPVAKPEPVDDEEVDPLLVGIDPKLIEIIKSEIIDNSKEISWNDIAGLTEAKEVINEAVVLPLLRPDLFQGLRTIPKAILLFGPPGTGKTLIGKCIAAHSQATFFSISASTLTSKWIGEGEKLVRALFRYARAKQPSVIFLDEIDSLLSKRKDSEHESSRRLKTEFLIQLEGANTTNEQDRLLLVGATNLPQELDDAARRRFTKRLYIPLPEFEARQELLTNLLQMNVNSLTHKDIAEIAQSSAGYSGADIKELCREAAMLPIREIAMSQVAHVQANSLRHITVQDFRKSLSKVKATVSPEALQQYTTWNKQYGCTS